MPEQYPHNEFVGSIPKLSSVISGNDSSCSNPHKDTGRRAMLAEQMNYDNSNVTNTKGHTLKHKLTTSTAQRNARPHACYTIRSSQIRLPARKTHEWNLRMAQGIATMLPDISLPTASVKVKGVRLVSDLDFGLVDILEAESSAVRARKDESVIEGDEYDSSANDADSDSEDECATETRIVSIVNDSDEKIYIADVLFTPTSQVFMVSDSLTWVADKKGRKMNNNSCLVIPARSSYEFLVGCVPGVDVGLRHQYIVVALVTHESTGEADVEIEYLGCKAVCMIQRPGDIKVLLDADAKSFHPMWMRTLFDNVAKLVICPTPPIGNPTNNQHEGKCNCKPVNALLAGVIEEEHQQINDIKDFDLYREKVQSVTSVRDKSFVLIFKVPSLIERRPEVLYGHVVRIREERTMLEHEILAYVWNVTRDIISVKLPARFRYWFDKSGTFYLRFMLDHTMFKVMAYALQYVHTHGLWIDTGNMISANSASNFQYVDESRAHFLKDLNTEQEQAVLGIAQCGRGEIYLVHGPPGTGKTTVVIGATRLIVDAGSKVLLCAPSHAAADVLAQRLAKELPSPQKTLLRLYPYQRDYSTVPIDVKPYTHIDPKSGLYTCPPASVLMAASIIVSTCISTAMLNDVPELRGTFSHIILDEAGQALEPEMLVAVAAVATKSTRIALVGDHMQLGPVVRSAEARRNGLHISPLERLQKMFTNKDEDVLCSLNRRMQLTQLTKNYRSHKTLLELPSKLFYNDTLESHVNEEGTTLLEWEELPTKTPLLFWGIAGHYHQDGESRSYFNNSEASLIATIVQKLLEYKAGAVSTNDIGVIAPFRKQVYNIRTLLRAKGLRAIRVGTVDDYQGQEEKIILISTVIGRNIRTQSQILKNFGSGLTGNPKRFNVAITRAKSLLVVVGDPVPLVHDPSWATFLAHCIHRNTYRGYPCPPLPGVDDSLKGKEATVDDLIERMGELLLGPGDESILFPDEDDLDSFYRDEMEFRCLV
eukprot:CFRG7812T1